MHFSVDSTRAGKLRRQWLEAGTGIPLELADCPDRRLAHAAARLAAAEAATPGTHVTVVLPRRSYPVLASRLLHDHTADRIARVVSRVPSAAATIIPFDVAAQGRGPAREAGQGGTKADSLHDYEWPVPPPGTDPIGSLRQPGQATVQGRLRAAQVRPVPRNNVLACEVADSTGDLTAVFYGRTQIAGLEPGRRVRLHGMVGIGGDGHPAMINPACELLGSRPDFAGPADRLPHAGWPVRIKDQSPWPDDPVGPATAGRADLASIGSTRGVLAEGELKCLGSSSASTVPAFAAGPGVGHERSGHASRAAHRAHRPPGHRGLLRRRRHLPARPGAHRADPGGGQGGSRQGAGRTDGPHPESVTVKAVHGFPVEELVNASKDADIVVLGSRGVGGFTRLLLGSTAGQVVQHAHCPVLIVPPEDRS